MTTHDLYTANPLAALGETLGRLAALATMLCCGAGWIEDSVSEHLS